MSLYLYAVCKASVCAYNDAYHCFVEAATLLPDVPNSGDLNLAVEAEAVSDAEQSPRNVPEPVDGLLTRNRHPREELP